MRGICQDVVHDPRARKLVTSTFKPSFSAGLMRLATPTALASINPQLYLDIPSPSTPIICLGLPAVLAARVIEIRPLQGRRDLRQRVPIGPSRSSNYPGRPADSEFGNLGADSSNEGRH